MVVREENVNSFKLTMFIWTNVIYVNALLLSTDYEDKGAVAISLNDTNSLSKDADPEKDDHVIKDIIPNLKDFLVAYSTVPSKSPL